MNYRRFIVPTLLGAGILAAASLGVQQAYAHHRNPPFGSRPRRPDSVARIDRRCGRVWVDRIGHDDGSRRPVFPARLS